MTTHYLDLTVMPDPETNAAQLMGALVGRLHLELVKQRSTTIGISFPRYSRNPRAIGPVLRLHSSASEIKKLMQEDWLKGLRDHLRMTEILPVPADVLHCVVSRKQFKTSAERLRRRRMQRKGETAEQAAAAIPATVERKPDLPYVQVRSHSTKQGFHLFIEQSALMQQPTAGTFNSYGLGGKTTIPWF